MPDSFLLQPGQTWVALGDSITEDPRGYVSIAEGQIRSKFPDYRVRVINAGVGGNKARDMVARFERDVLQYEPDWVSISVGVNDVWHGFYDFEKGEPLTEYDSVRGEPLDEYRRDLESMLAKLRTVRAGAILISPTMIGEDPGTRENLMIASYVATMKEMAAAHGAIYCGMNERMWSAIGRAKQITDGMIKSLCAKVGREMHESDEIRITTDGVHMTWAGAAAMADCLLRTIRLPGWGSK